MKYIVLTILALLLGIFFYWAYLPDYRRDPKEFKRTLIGMPLGIFFSWFGFNGINERIKRWATDKKSK